MAEEVKHSMRHTTKDSSFKDVKVLPETFEWVLVCHTQTYYSSNLIHDLVIGNRNLHL